MIRKCHEEDFLTLYGIIQDAARAYRGVIPSDCWKEPYMPLEELRHEIEAGVEFWGEERENRLMGVMGIQPVGEVSLIRHAYVITERQKMGIGSILLLKLKELTVKPLLVGTWADAGWAVRFYEKHGFRLVSSQEKDRLLKKYWTIPERQIETSVVLADANWFMFQGD